MDYHLAHTQQTLPAGWECALDQATGHWYYYNRESGATTWVPPPQSNAHATAIAAPAAAAAATTSDPAASVPTSTSARDPSQVSRGSGSGWYYRDRGERLHGPFQRDQLRAWRAFLPMDLSVWFVELRQQRQATAPDNTKTTPTSTSTRGLGERQAHQQAGGEEGEEEEEDQTRAGPRGDGNKRDGGLETAAAGGGSGGGVGGLRRSGGGGDGCADQPVTATATVQAAITLGLGDYAADTEHPTTAAGGGGRPESEAVQGGEDDDGAEPQGQSGGDGIGGGDGVGGGDGPASAEEAIAAGLPGIELAELLGDGPLLADWRQRFPGSRPPGTAPPAVMHDHWLRAASATAAAAHAYGTGGRAGQHYGAVCPHSHSVAAEDGSGSAAIVNRPRSREESMMEYAEAVLAGLPPDDEAVVLARQAAAAGKTLAEVVKFSWAAAGASTSTTHGAVAAAMYGGDIAAAAGPPAAVDKHGVPMEYTRDPRSGRLTAVGGREASPQNVARSLYGEYGGWVNPDQLEEYLAKAQRWRREQLPALWARTKLREQREAKAKRVARAAMTGGI